MKKACRCKPRNEATSKERADIHDTSPNAFNALAQPTGNSNALLHQLRPGTIDNTSSDEAFNGGIKKALDRNRGKVANQISAISRHLKATSEREYQLFGISHIPPIFPAHDRFKGDAEADQMRIGMCFLGRCDKKLFMDQRQILSMQGQGADPFGTGKGKRGVKFNAGKRGASCKRIDGKHSFENESNVFGAGSIHLGFKLFCCPHACTSG
mmetsp:Transcript_19773/g.30357  ORF Transcript_19773/g.30357 Transcript_19773/m.30357 type:complete len:211 (-) Transcript_19773:185-817(-)